MSNSKEVDKIFNFLRPIEFKKMIRLGNKFDGGYVVPETLTKETDGLISFGYGYDPAFEYDYINFTKKKSSYLWLFMQLIPFNKTFFEIFKKILFIKKKVQRRSLPLQ